MGNRGVTIHQTAEVSPDAAVGAGTRVWNEAQVREGAQVGRDCILGKGVYVDSDVVVGDRVKLENRVSLFRGARVGSGVFIGPHSCLLNDKEPRSGAAAPSCRASTSDVSRWWERARLSLEMYRITPWRSAIPRGWSATSANAVAGCRRTAPARAAALASKLCRPEGGAGLDQLGEDRTSEHDETHAPAFEGHRRRRPTEEPRPPGLELVQLRLK